MGDLRGIRHWGPVARLLTHAVLCCCAGLGALVSPAAAQELVEPRPGGIRLLKGAEWFEDWRPGATGAWPSPRIVELKGTRRGGPPAQLQQAPSVPAPAKDDPAAEMPLLSSVFAPME